MGRIRHADRTAGAVIGDRTLVHRRVTRTNAAHHEFFRNLLELADENDGEHITKRITHHLIAQMIGSSREAVSRTMRNLVDRQLIEVSRSRITLCDRDSLETAAGRDTMGPAQRFHYDGANDRRKQDGHARR